MGLLRDIFTRFVRTDSIQHGLDKWRTDGWFSALSGFGTTKDKRTSIDIAPRVITDQQAENLWRTDDMAAKIVEIIPYEVLRQGFGVKAGDKKLSEDIISVVEDLKVIPHMLMAKNFQRAYGGGAIFPVINDGSGNLAEPLREDSISDIKCLHVFQRRELTAKEWYTDLTDEKFGYPKTFYLIPLAFGGMTGSQVEIHESRLVIFRGPMVSKTMLSVYPGWGDSNFTRVFDVLADFGISWAATATLLHEFSMASFKIKGLAQLLAADKDDIIKARIRAVALSRSTINATMMDAEEEYERKQTPVAGLADLLDRFNTRLSSAADLPVTRLFGVSPAGLNATGESDKVFLYDRVKADQDLNTKDQVERMIYLIMRMRQGPTRGKLPKIWSVEFKPLWQPSEKEQAETRKIVADTDIAYIQNGVVDPDTVRRSRFEGDTYSSEMHIDSGEMDELESPDKDAQLEEKEPDQLTAGSEDQVMNSGSVSALLDIVEKVVAGQIPRESAIAILKVAYGLDENQAQEILGPENFENDDDLEDFEDDDFIQGSETDDEEAHIEDDTEENIPSSPNTRSDYSGWEKKNINKRMDFILHSKGKWRVYSKSGEELGSHETEEEAQSQLAAIEMNKHHEG